MRLVTRRIFLIFTSALAVSAASPSESSSDVSSWQALETFTERCLSETPSPESLSRTAAQLGWIPLSEGETRALVPPMGVVPGVHFAWRVPSENLVVEVGGSGMWNLARVLQARDSGELVQGPLPDVQEEGADTRFGRSNHWTCRVHFTGGDPALIKEALKQSAVRDSVLGSPLIEFDELDNRPGWASVDWHVGAERSLVSFTYRTQSDAVESTFTRELHLGFFTNFTTDDGEGAKQSGTGE
jgi:hypothetical protein